MHRDPQDSTVSFFSLTVSWNRLPTIPVQETVDQWGLSLPHTRTATVLQTFILGCILRPRCRLDILKHHFKEVKN